MIILRLQGGLGNQLFQYALYLQLAQSGKTVRIDDVSGFVDDTLRCPVLKEVFDIPYERAEQGDIDRLRDSAMDPLHRARRLLFGRNLREWQEPDARFHPEVLSMDQIYLDGYFQSEAYFPDPTVRSRLRSALTGDGIRRKILNASGADTLAEMIADASGQSVSLHIRRGDYLQPQTAVTHGGICTEAYYAQAIRLIRERISDPVFFLFSDDPAFASEFAAAQERLLLDASVQNQVALRGPAATGEPVKNAHFRLISPSQGTKAERDAADLLLMSSCRHHIMANSSFSWWGSWLGERTEDRIIIAPDRWFNNRADDGIYTEEMIRLPG